MGSFSLIHWIIVGIAILLLFGGNRFSAMMGDVAKGLKSFKRGMADDEDEQRARAEEQARLSGHDRPIDVRANPRAADPVAPPVTPVPPVTSADEPPR
jgi:sec-independent protein translocase protein TatA